MGVKDAGRKTVGKRKIEKADIFGSHGYPTCKRYKRIMSVLGYSERQRE